MARQIVVRPIVDPADLLEPAQTVLADLDVKMHLVVERPLVLVELRESEPVAGNAKTVEVEPLHDGHVVRVESREAGIDQVADGAIRCTGFLFLRGHRDPQGLGPHGVHGNLGIEFARVEEDLELRLEEFPHAVRPLAGRDLVPVRTPDDGEPHR